MIETFETQIAANKRSTVFIVAGLCALLAVIGATLGGAVSNGDPSAMMTSLVITFIGSALGALISYHYAPDIVLGLTGSQRIAKVDDPELFNVVEEMSIAAGIPMPSVYLVNDAAMNAFATGKDPAHAAVSITTGLRSRLSREELQGVIAHEIGHIVNYDIRLMMVAAVVGGAIALLSDFIWRTGRYRGGSRRYHRENNSGGIFLVIGIVVALVAPIVSKLLQLAISRQREFLADATAVKLTRNPHGLSSALVKLVTDTDPLDHENRALEHLYIVSPTRKLNEANLDSVWSTHPPIRARVQRIMSLAV